MGRKESNQTKTIFLAQACVIGQDKLIEPVIIPTLFLKRWRYCNRLHPSVRPSVLTKFLVVCGHVPWLYQYPPGGFMLLWFYVQELPKAQPAMVLVIYRLRRRGNGLKSHWDSRNFSIPSLPLGYPLQSVLQIYSL